MSCVLPSSQMFQFKLREICHFIQGNVSSRLLSLTWQVTLQRTPCPLMHSKHKFLHKNSAESRRWSVWLVWKTCRTSACFLSPEKGCRTGVTFYSPEVELDLNEWMNEWMNECSPCIRLHAGLTTSWLLLFPEMIIWTSHSQWKEWNSTSWKRSLNGGESECTRV